MPKPVLQAMVIADHVYQDRRSGKFVIAGTFGTIYLATRRLQPESGPSEMPSGRHLVSGPISQMGSPFLYLALTEVHGQIPLQLKFVDLAEAAVLFEAEFEVRAVDPVAVAEYSLPLLPLPVAKAGTFSLDLIYEGEILGSWRITVKKAPDPSGEAEIET